MSESKSILASLAEEVVQVSVDGASAWMLRRDLPTLARSSLNTRTARLLPAFDTLLLAHATKEHLVEPRYYKRVYRSQGWISPVVLLGGMIVGVWFLKTTGKTSTLDVQLFKRTPLAVREASKTRLPRWGFSSAPVARFALR